ncbi:TonB-dependent receptor plug domain-containing protein [Neolewinella agarilytica]|uniref:TonB-dependent receptor plug domain-containing protein n=1 Tax=Neolewinella agarilytica TaxID=478744 RepID=UPI002354594C|nr:TonB-dependent receptor [Neolewinella agarilytica]
MKQLILCLFFSGAAVSVIGAQADSLLLSVNLKDIVVTAEYAPTEARNAIHKVTVLTQKEWREQGISDLSELLQRQLTMRVSPDPILGNGLSIQGLGGQNIQIMIDGVPVIGRLGGEIDLTQLNLARFSRVEVIAGALSARYGSDAAGGVINLVTAREQADKWKVEAGGRYETVDLDRQFLRLGRQLGSFQIYGGLDRYSARFGSVDSLRAGASPWNPKDQFGYDINLRYQPSDSLSLRYGYRSFSETLTLYGEVRRPEFLPYVVDQIFDTWREDHALSVNYRLSPKLNADLTAGWNTFDRHKQTQRRDLEPDTTSLVIDGQDTTRYTGSLLRLSLSAKDGMRGKLSGQIGLEYRRESGAGGRILDTASLSNEPAINNLAAWIGLRYRLQRDWTAEATVRAGYNSRYEHPFVPAFHLLWKPSPAWRWRLGYAAGFRAPAIQELFFSFIDVNHYIIGSQELTAERSHNFRLNGEWSGNKKWPLAISGAIFYNRISDRITLADVADGRFSYVNLEEYRTHGATVQFVYTPNERWTITTGGAMTRLLNTLATPENESPEFLSLGEANNQLNYRLPKAHLSIRLDHRYVGRQDRYQAGADGQLSQGVIGDYHLLHFSLNKGFLNNRIQLTAGVKNLLNRDRVPVTGGTGGDAHTGGSAGQLIDFGRSAFLGLAARW